MKTELKKKLEPYFVQLEEVENDLNRIMVAQRDCIKSKGYNGCWNCDVKESDCAVAQTKTMVHARKKVVHRNIVCRVKEWLEGV